MQRIALGVLLLGTALAGGWSPATASDEALFPFAESQLRHPNNNPVPLIVDVDFSQVKVFRHGAPRLLITFTGAQQNVFGIDLNALDSRPLRAGEKAHWEGQISTNSAYLVRVVDEASTSVIGSKAVGQPIKIVLTGNAAGQWSLSNGYCKPSPNGVCSGPIPK